MSTFINEKIQLVNVDQSLVSYEELLDLVNDSFVFMVGKQKFRKVKEDCGSNMCYLLAVSYN